MIDLKDRIKRNSVPFVLFTILFAAASLFNYLQGTATTVIGGSASLTGCTNPSNGIACTGPITGDTLSAGDGTKSSAIILPELAVNGSSDTRIYGADSQAASTCITIKGGITDSTSGKGLFADGTTATMSDGSSCTNMTWQAPAAGGTTMGTGAWKDPVPFSFLSTSNYTTAPSDPNKVYLTKFQAEATITVAKIAFPVHTNGDYIQFGIYNQACDTKLGSTTPLAHTTVADIATFASPVALTGGTVYYLATTTDGNTSTGWSPWYDNGFGYLQAAIKKNSSNVVMIAGTDSTGSAGSLALPAACGSNVDGDVLYTWATRMFK
jgi:hypothetical protein